MADYTFQNQFMNAYLDYVSGTEPPKIFHVWSLVSAVSGALGRRCYLPLGHGDIYPNMYVLLVGSPGSRKSTAIRLASKLLKDHTQIRFLAEDTAGQRQGIIAAMGEHTFEADVEQALREMERQNTGPDDLLGFGGGSNKALDMLANINIDTRDKHSMFLRASEFATFIGQNNTQLINFLVDMWDGKEEYEYKTKGATIMLKDPLLSIIGGTTPMLIAECLPPAAIGGGFTSRFVMVYADSPEANNAFPDPLDLGMKEALGNVFADIFTNMNGAFSLAPEAKAFLTSVYKEPFPHPDPRFIYYSERRFTHLLKLCMTFAAMRLSNVIELIDALEAHALLSATETHMPDALGELGLSPLSAAKQKLIEFIISSKVPVHLELLWAIMQRDMKRVDFTGCIADLVTGGKIMRVDTNDGPAYVGKTQNRKNNLSSLLNTISQQHEQRKAAE